MYQFLLSPEYFLGYCFKDTNKHWLGNHRINGRVTGKQVIIFSIEYAIFTIYLSPKVPSLSYTAAENITLQNGVIKANFQFDW